MKHKKGLETLKQEHWCIVHAALFIYFDNVLGHLFEAVKKQEAFIFLKHSLYLTKTVSILKPLSEIRHELPNTETVCFLTFNILSVWKEI